MHRIIWDQSLIETLQDLRNTGQSLWACSHELGINHESVRAKCRELGLSRDRRWSPEDEKQAWELRHRPITEIAQAVGRTYIAVNLKLRRMGFTKQKRDGTQRMSETERREKARLRMQRIRQRRQS